MLHIPSPPGVKVISNDTIVGSLTPWTSVPFNATTLLYGAVTELISAANNTQDSWGVEVLAFGTGASAASTPTCLDILIGGATDDVLIPGLLCGQTYNAAIRSWYFPVHVPAGVRIAARAASVRTSAADTDGVRVCVRLYGGAPPPHKVGRKVTTYGTKPSAARGLSITPAASGAAASVTQMTASTTERHFAFLPSFQLGGDTAVATSALLAVGIGIGAATEERIGTWWFAIDTQEAAMGPIPGTPVYREVPSGTRLTMLVSNSTTNESGYDGLVHAVS